MNDGTALVVFTVLKAAVAAGRVTQSAGEIIWVFLYMSAGGALFGILVASIFIVWIGGVFNNPMAEISGIVSIAVSFDRLRSFSTIHKSNYPHHSTLCSSLESIFSKFRVSSLSSRLVFASLPMARSGSALK